MNRKPLNERKEDLLNWFLDRECNEKGISETIELLLEDFSPEEIEEIGFDTNDVNAVLRVIMEK